MYNGPFRVSIMTPEDEALELLAGHNCSNCVFKLSSNLCSNKARKKREDPWNMMEYLPKDANGICENYEHGR